MGHSKDAGDKKEQTVGKDGPWVNLQKMKLRKQKPKPQGYIPRFLLQNLLKMTKLRKERTGWPLVGLEGWEWRDEGSGRGSWGWEALCLHPCHHPGVTGLCRLQHVTTGRRGIKSLYYFLQLHVNLPHLKI